MKKLIKSLSILMMSAMLILPTAVSTQAEEVINIKNDDMKSVSSITNTAMTKEAVHLRDYPSAYDGNVLTTIPANKYIKIDYNNPVKSDGHWWYHCRYDGKIGYVIANAVQYIPGT